MLCYTTWIQVRSATPLNIKTVKCDNHEVCSRQEVKNMKYTHLTENERYMISALRKQGISTAKIAKQLGRHKATIYREIERNIRYNKFFERYSYQPERAQQMARSRLSRSRRNKRYDAIDFKLPEALLRLDWSPEQIVGYLKVRGVNIPFLVALKIRVFPLLRFSQIFPRC